MSHLLTFWQNIPSIHQAPMIREIAKIWPGPVRVVTEGGTSDSRRRQGWPAPDFGDAQLIVGPKRSTRETLILESQASDSTHLLSGISAYQETSWTLRRLVQTDAFLGTMVEGCRFDEGIKSIFRKLRYRAEVLRWGAHLDLVLAMGQNGCQWWRSVGFPAHKVIPFCYAVDMPDGAIVEVDRSAHVFRVILVGAVIRLKGIDLVLRALAGITDLPWQLEIVGSGPLESDCRQLAMRLGVDSRVRWLGNVPNDEVFRRMAASDLLVLASRFDGWGAVVNEALSVGTPVLCSDACGAKDLVLEDERGGVFPSGDVEAMTSALRMRIQRGMVSIEERKRIRNWARNCIAPVVVARYLVGILEEARSGKGIRTIEPWRGDSAE